MVSDVSIGRLRELLQKISLVYCVSKHVDVVYCFAVLGIRTTGSGTDKPLLYIFDDSTYHYTV